jgi:predicted nucleotide-binding protein (sugar kinase/HSP70/actin superfamily)
LRLKKSTDPNVFDYVAIRQNLLFKKYFPQEIDVNNKTKTVGIMRSFLTHSLGVLYLNFFSALGFKIVISDEIDSIGIARTEAAFCLPVEISHGNFLALLKKNLDYIFLPHVLEIPVSNVQTYSKTCVFVQGEPYYLKTTFRKEIEQSQTVILSPILKMDKEYEQAERNFVILAMNMSISKKKAKQVFREACQKQQQFEEELLDYGKKALEFLDTHPDTFGIVLLGRPYNAFADEANMGIPHKIASRNMMVIPFDMLLLDDYVIDKKMYWAMGQKIMKAAQMIKKRKNLFGVYITNFSCGPDSFILGYFRDCMKSKPSLTLELDQHTADGGIDTRIEAALDIMRVSYNTLNSPLRVNKTKYIPARIIYGKQPYIISSHGVKYSLYNSQVEMVFTSMGKFSTQSVAAVFRSCGIMTKALPIPDENTLLEGKKNTICKECLPYAIVVGSFMSYLKTMKNSDKLILLFMTTGEGPCRLGQYSNALEQIIIKNKLNNVAIFSLTDEDGYAGLGNRMLIRSWQAIVISDVFNEIKSMLAVTAQDKDKAMRELEDIWDKELMPFFERTLSINLTKVLSNVNYRLSQIPLKKDPQTVPIVSLVGEIFVRNEEFSRGNVIDYLENHGFVVKVASVGEYLCYSNYLINHGLGDRKFSLKERAKIKIATQIQKLWESRIKSILAKSGLYKFEMTEVDKTIKNARHLINENLQGEGILTVGLALREILHNSCGVISIGPFGCMPSRMAEAILKKEMNIVGKKRMPEWQQKAVEFNDIDTFPFLSLETDGTPYPQIVEANLEAFILQAKRVHEKLQCYKK